MDPGRHQERPRHLGDVQRVPPFEVLLGRRVPGQVQQRRAPPPHREPDRRVEERSAQRRDRIGLQQQRLELRACAVDSQHAVAVVIYQPEFGDERQDAHTLRIVDSAERDQRFDRATELFDGLNATERERRGAHLGRQQRHHPHQVRPSAQTGARGSTRRGGVTGVRRVPVRRLDHPGPVRRRPGRRPAAAPRPRPPHGARGPAGLGLGARRPPLPDRQPVPDGPAPAGPQGPAGPRRPGPHRQGRLRDRVVRRQAGHRRLGPRDRRAPRTGTPARSSCPTTASTCSTPWTSRTSRSSSSTPSTPPASSRCPRRQRARSQPPTPPCSCRETIRAVTIRHGMRPSFSPKVDQRRRRQRRPPAPEHLARRHQPLRRLPGRGEAVQRGRSRPPSRVVRDRLSLSRELPQARAAHVGRAVRRVGRGEPRDGAAADPRQPRDQVLRPHREPVPRRRGRDRGRAGRHRDRRRRCPRASTSTRRCSTAPRGCRRRSRRPSTSSRRTRS